ncbi:diguanylate cyclase [Achromobacter sp. ES-001]|uniref:diguanylate cyclase n=1 Tax=Achromobacter sp. ES-001 TaxID=2860286 RepID=UPI001C644024|nr:diguanylate cyclase [Achromobacter sp. ES-001]QYJ23925.1 diguanylate cyclase [Achromobacter sp. ES-001]
MDIFTTIHTHIAALGLPLYAVSASAVQKADTPILLTLHWHGFKPDRTAIAQPLRSVAASALQLNQRWSHYAEIDEAVLEAGWRLGAWDVERVAHPGWCRLNAPLEEAVACRRAFADYSDLPGGQERVALEAPDHSALMELAARKGYLRWMFRPRKNGIWNQTDADDATVDAEGGRTQPCPVHAAPAAQLQKRVTFRLGKAVGIWVCGDVRR